MVSALVLRKRCAVAAKGKNKSVNILEFVVVNEHVQMRINALLLIAVTSGVDEKLSQ